MIVRIQDLKQPKITSGKPLVPGKTLKAWGLVITNNTKFPLYVDSYMRKPYKRKGKKKK